MDVIHICLCLQYPIFSTVTILEVMYSDQNSTLIFSKVRKLPLKNETLKQNRIKPFLIYSHQLCIQPN